MISIIIKIVIIIQRTFAAPFCKQFFSCSCIYLPMQYVRPSRSTYVTEGITLIHCYL